VSREQDLTSGPITPALARFALPALGSGVLQSLNGSINAIWIGQFLGEAALAATTNATLVMFLLFAAVFGFGMAASILVGQNVGAKNLDGARRAIGSAVGLFLLLSIVTAVGGWLGAPGLLRLLSTPADVFPLALGYLRLVLLSMPASFLTVLVMMSLRGFGDAMTPLWFMILATLLDIALNPVFILGLGPAPALGIEGSAVATIISTAIGLIAMIVFIYARDLPMRLRGAELRYILPERTILRTVLGKGIPMGLQMVVLSTSALAMIGLVNRQGTMTTAAYGAVSQLWTYLQMPAMAVGAAVSAMVAQNIGASRWDRVNRINWTGVGISAAATLVLVALALFFDNRLFWLFLGSDAAAQSIAERMNLIATWTMIPFSVTMVLGSTVRANGAVFGPLVILAVAFFPVRFGFAYALEPGWGADAIWWSFPLGSVAAVLMTVGFYLHGGWRRERLITPGFARPERSEA
jgi:putative MATE family efflux protein